MSISCLLFFLGWGLWVGCFGWGAWGGGAFGPSPPAVGRPTHPTLPKKTCRALRATPTQVKNGSRFLPPSGGLARGQVANATDKKSLFPSGEKTGPSRYKKGEAVARNTSFFAIVKHGHTTYSYLWGSL